MIGVRYRGEYRLAVTFADGTSGEVDASRLILGAMPGVFAELRDTAKFREAFVDDGAVAWPGGLDLAPDAMYDAIRSCGTWLPE